MIYLHHILRLILASILLVAGTMKLLNMPEFVESVGHFGLVPDGLVNQTAWVVVLVEFVIGVCLALRLRGSLLAVMILLGLFVSVLTYGIVLGLDIHCGCFGPGFHVSLQTQLLIDAVLVVLVGVTYWSGVRCPVERTKIAPSEVAKES